MTETSYGGRAQSMQCLKRDVVTDLLLSERRRVCNPVLTFSKLWEALEKEQIERAQPRFYKPPTLFEPVTDSESVRGGD